MNRFLPKEQARRIKKSVDYIVGGLLILLIILGLMSRFSDSISAHAFRSLAMAFVLLVLLLTFFRWLSTRSAVIFTVVASILVLGVMVPNKSLAVKEVQFQAVFLTNGQVYFGHLRNPETKNPLITDVYYLQSDTQNLQQNNKGSSQPAQLSLVKLGNELHGPEDAMALKSDQILFWENLKDSSKVVQSIKNGQL